MTRGHVPLVLAFLLMPGAAAESAEAPSVFVTIVADTVPPQPTPFAVGLTVHGAPNTTVELKATVASGGVALARAWTGAAWAPGTRYGPTVTLDAAGSWHGFVGLALNRDVPPNATVDVEVRARERDGGRPGPVARAPVRVVVPTYAAAFDVPDTGVVVTRPDGSVLGVATGTGANLAVVTAPERPATVTQWAGATPGEREPAPPPAHVTITRVDGPHDTVTVRGNGLAGVCVNAGTARACLEATAATSAVVPVRVPDKSGAVTATLGPIVLDSATFKTAPRRQAWLRDGDAWRLDQPDAGPASKHAAARVVPVVLPRDGYAAVTAVADGAAHRLDVAAYTLTSPAVARVLADAAARGVAVRVLVDAAPAGGLDSDERGVLAALAAKGVEVRVARDPFAASHAKYVVADDARTFVTSENFNAASFAVSGAAARSGWGVIVDDAAVAARFAAAFAADRARGEAPPTARPVVLPARVAALPWLAPVAGANVTVAFAPEDAVDVVVAVLDAAETSIDVMQLRTEVWWRDGPSPFLAALENAARRGVAVRLLVDGSFTDPENAAAVRALNALASEGLKVAARSGPPDVLLHNKGVIVDGRVTVVGSLNWVRAAAFDNREAIVVVDSSAAAAVWTDAFNTVWAPQAETPAVGAIALALVAITTAAARKRVSLRR